MSEPLVSTAWLAQRLGDPAVVPVDGSFHMPGSGRDARAEWRQRRIPGAVFFDIDAIADASVDLPHMFPSEETFARAAEALGIGDESTVVVYDALGLFSAPRVWWTLRAFGLKNVHVLDGGAPKWIAEGRPLEAGEPQRASARFHARLDRSFVVDWRQVAEAMRLGAPQILDARSAERFRGEAPEPRPGLRSGHIPGSLNLPWTEIVADGRMVEPDALRLAFARAGVDVSKSVITTCGSGVSAALVSLALERIGGASAVYDGSWAEWGGRRDLPLQIG